MRSLIAKVELMEITESKLNLKVVFLKGIIDQSMCVQHKQTTSLLQGDIEQAP